MEACMRILLVDDERHVRRALARSLEASGHVVTEAERGVDALAMLEGDPVDLLVLDVNLPDMSGWEVLRTGQARRLQSPPVVIISAVPPSVARQQEFRPLGVLHKPFPLESLHRLAVLAATGSPNGKTGTDD
jgi:DNA-binding response OmpR family regulator